MGESRCLYNPVGLCFVPLSMYGHEIWPREDGQAARTTEWLLSRLPTTHSRQIDVDFGRSFGRITMVAVAQVAAPAEVAHFHEIWY